MEHSGNLFNPATPHIGTTREETMITRCYMRIINTNFNRNLKLKNIFKNE